MPLKLNPITGKLDLVGSGGSPTPSPDNFSYDFIPTGATVTIPLYQQMIVSQNIQVDGTLIMNGTLVII